MGIHASAQEVLARPHNFRHATSWSLDRFVSGISDCAVYLYFVLIEVFRQPNAAYPDSEEDREVRVESALRYERIRSTTLLLRELMVPLTHYVNEALARQKV